MSVDIVIWGWCFESSELKQKRSLFCTICVKYPPQVIACASLYQSFKDFGKALPADPPWWELFDSDIKDISTIVAELEILYSRPIFKYVPSYKKDMPGFVAMYGSTGAPDLSGSEDVQLSSAYQPPYHAADEGTDMLASSSRDNSQQDTPTDANSSYRSSATKRSCSKREDGSPKLYRPKTASRENYSPEERTASPPRGRGVSPRYRCRYPDRYRSESQRYMKPPARDSSHRHEHPPRRQSYHSYRYKPRR